MNNVLPPSNELFVDFYNNIKDDSWPTYSELIQLDQIPVNILRAIVSDYQLSDEVDNTESNRIDIICQNLLIDSIPESVFDDAVRDSNPFVDFYNNIKNDDWPLYDELTQLDSIPVNILHAIVKNYHLPDKPESERIDIICQNLLIDSIPESVFDDDINEKQELILHHASNEMHHYFFWSTVDFYRQKTTVLDLLSVSIEDKPKFFDVLLGRKKYHRDLIYQSIDHEKNIVTYLTDDESVNLAACNQQNFIWPLDVISNSEIDITSTADIVIVEDTIVSLSQIVPVSVYNQTRYSLVCETQCENSFSFFTEKIIKPMLARRLYLVSSGRHFLKNLRSLGFKTFDGIIDESYDSEWKVERRTEMIIEQMEYLYTADASQIMQESQPIVQHNFDLLMNKDWQKEMATSVCQHIQAHL